MLWWRVIAVVSFWSCLTVKAQFEDVKECVMHEEFVSYLIDCFVAKFYAMKPPNASRPFEAEMESFETGSHINRKLQSIVESTSAPSHHYLPQMNNKKSRVPEMMKTKQSIVDQAQQMFLDMTKDAPVGRTGSSELEQMLDVFQHGGKLNSELLSLLRPVYDSLTDLKVQLDQMQTVLNSGEESDEFSRDQVVDELVRMKNCLDSLNEEEFEDGFTWLRCLYTCNDLPITSSCMIDTLNLIPACGRVPWVADLIMRLFVDYVKLQTCFFEVLSPDVSSIPVTLTEGRSDDVEGVATQIVEFRSFLTPGVHCFPMNAIANRRALIGDIVGLVFGTTPPCVVQIQMTTSNNLYDILPYIRIETKNGTVSLGRPRCRNGTAVNQISIGWHEHAVNSSGIIVLDRSNWNTTFRVPIAARVDHKVEDDDYTEVNFTMKMVVDTEILNTTKILTRVYNKDVDPSICQSINDPHIVTFDNRYYNNLQQGYFQFYKHSTLPYEVQLIYQSCGLSAPKGESCNCGVAVRSGDDVFVVDRCRLKPEHCSTSGEDCRLLKVTLYVNGELTPGTRIFQKDGGLSYEVILPHGTIVKIKSNGQEFINVWIIPSPYDRDQTSGLCGTFNVDPDDDFTSPNGTLIDHPDPDTQPLEFIEAWRLQPQDQLFEGALPSGEPFQTTNYCRCAHYILAGIECHCGFGELVETCDMNLENEFTFENVSCLIRHSKRASNQTTDDQRDINTTRVPDPSQLKPGETVRADQHCRSFLHPSLSFLLNHCTRGRNTSHESFENAYAGCIDDYKITRNTTTIEWKMAATDAAKVGCMTFYERSTTMRTDWVKQTENETCINECYDRGSCEFGRCQCDSGYTGADCSLSTSGSQTPVLMTEESILCDRRHEDCAFATVYGKNFIDDGSLVCNAIQIKVLDTEPQPNSAKYVDVGVIFINLNQMVCRLPNVASYRFTVKHKGTTLAPLSVSREYSSQMTFMTYDSVCHVCDSATHTCSRKKDGGHCLVDGVCYENNQVYSVDTCKYCNITYSTDGLYDSLDPVCVAKREEEAQQRADDKKSQDIRIAVGCSLSALIIIITIIGFILTRRKEKRMKSFDTSDVSSSVGEKDDKITYTNPEFSPDDGKPDPASTVDGKQPHGPVNNNNSMSPYATYDPQIVEYIDEHDAISELDTPAGSPVFLSPSSPAPETLVIKSRDLARVKAQEEGRVRTSSQVSSSSIRAKGHVERKESDAGSVKSLGIGGGGPIGLSRTLGPSREGSNADQLGIGARGIPSATPVGRAAAVVLTERL